MTGQMLDQVLAEARRLNAARVTRIDLLVGQEAGVVPECVQFYFDQMKPGTAAAEAELRFRRISLRLKCPRCLREFERLEEICGCNCGAEILRGQELMVEKIEVAGES